MAKGNWSESQFKKSKIIHGDEKLWAEASEALLAESMEETTRKLKMRKQLRASKPKLILLKEAS